MLFSTNRIKELRLRIETFGLPTNQDFYIHLVEKNLRASHAPGILFLLPFECLPRRIINYDHARKVGKYKSDDTTAAKFFATPLLCSKQIKLQTTPWLYLHFIWPHKA